MAIKVFITGATGYIGGAILSELLKTPQKYSISALVRKPEHGEVLKKLNVTPVYGSLDDAEVLVEASRNADVVINAANSDHLPAVHAIVKGLKEKKDKNAILIHTSGSAAISFDPITTVPFDDEDIARIHAIPKTVIHRDVDTFIYDNSDHFKAVIVAPSTINGTGKGPFKKSSAQVPLLAQIAVKRRKSGYFGREHEVVWSDVHIDDLADLYILILGMS
jgi:nucleoside-diphosphate-sugar epimerase